MPDQPDRVLRLCITDMDTHCVCVYSFGGKLIHRFGEEGKKRGDFINPRGIAIDVEGWIIVASDKPEHCISSFLNFDRYSLLHISYFYSFIFLLLQTICSDSTPSFSLFVIPRISVYVHIGYLNLQHFMTYDMPVQA